MLFPYKRKLVNSQEIGVILPSLHKLSSAIVLGSISKKTTIRVCRTQAIEQILDVFYKCGRIRGYSYPNSTEIEVGLGYYKNMPYIRRIDVFKASASLRHFTLKDLYHYSVKFEVVNPSKILLLTSNRGIVTHWEAMLNKVGGIGLLELR